MRAELLLDCRNAHGEGIFWSAQHRLLYWTDIHGECVWTYQPQVGRARSRGPGPGLLLRRTQGRPPNEVVAAFADGFALLDLSMANGATSRRSSRTCRPHGSTTAAPTGRAVSSRAAWTRTAQPISSVWRLDPDLTVTRLFGDVGCANGTCFSPDGRTMWFADSATGGSRLRLRSETGALGARRTVAQHATDRACRTALASTPKALSGTRSGKAIGSSVRAGRALDRVIEFRSRSRPAARLAARTSLRFSSQFPAGRNG